MDPPQGRGGWCSGGAGEGSICPAVRAPTSCQRALCTIGFILPRVPASAANGRTMAGLYPTLSTQNPEAQAENTCGSQQECLHQPLSRVKPCRRQDSLFMLLCLQLSRFSQAAWPNKNCPNWFTGYSCTICQCQLSIRIGMGLHYAVCNMPNTHTIRRVCPVQFHPVVNGPGFSHMGHCLLI